MLTAEQTNAAHAALREAGLLVDNLEFDGTLHRVPTQDKPRSKNGVYAAFSDAPVSVWWQNWATSKSGTWTAKGESKLTVEERAELARRTETTRAAREAEQARVHAEAAAKAKAIYDAAADCAGHPYLEHKGVKAVPGLKLSIKAVTIAERHFPVKSLIVPAFDEQGQVRAIQYINNDANDNKRFPWQSDKKGRFFPLGGKDADKPLVICEGLATGLSLHECLARPVLVAFDAGNLLPVAELARARYPEREIILAADNDIEVTDNPGLTKATAAALAVNGSLAVPRHEGRSCDWNDLHRLMGPGEVQVQFMNHGKPETQQGGEMDQNGQKAATLRCVNAYECLSLQFPEREMLLSPILPRQGLCMLHAMRGIGKTFISLSVAFAVASGGKLFDRWGAPKPARVLFLDGEMPARTLQERLASIVAGSNSEVPDNDYLRILTPDMQDGPMPNLATREGQEAVAPFLEGVDLVIMDNLATLARHGRSNDEESWLPVQGWLLELRRRGLSALMVHHQGKGGDQRGTSAKEDILDTVIRLDRPKDYRPEQGARFEIHLTKARGICGEDAKPFEAQLATMGRVLTWTTRDIEDAELDQLRTLFAEGYSYRDAAEEMGVSVGKVQRLKKKLESSDSRISSSTDISSSIGGEAGQ